MKDLKLKFDDSFFNEEIKCDYLVTKELKKIHAVQLDLLFELLRVCEKHNINVYVFAGTLLGAVRHGGFIPWDDDIDVCMDRNNYKKLISFSDEFQYPYFLQHALNDTKYFLGYARLRNSDTTGLIKGNVSLDYNNGIYIDIFVLDGLIEDSKLLDRQIKIRNLLQFIIQSKEISTSNVKGFDKFFIFLSKHIVLKIVGYNRMVQFYNNCISKYTNSSDYLTMMTHTKDFLLKYKVKKSNFNGKNFLRFEFIKAPVYDNYLESLEEIYGDYMLLPPVSERGKWHDDQIILNPDISYKEYIELNYSKVMKWNI